MGIVNRRVTVASPGQTLKGQERGRRIAPIATQREKQAVSGMQIISFDLLPP